MIVEGKHVLLIHFNEAIYAYEDRCAHKGVALSEGTLSGQTLICSAHHWQYDICSGKGTNPSSASLKKFPVRVDNGDILVDLDVVT